MADFEYFTDYIRLSTSTKERISRIDTIIRALEDAELKGADNADLEEYDYNDGQTRIKTIFRNLSSIPDTIEKLEKQKQRLINRCIGGRYSLRDGNVKNVNRWM